MVLSIIKSMDNKSKALLICVFLIVFLSIAFVFYKTIILQEFEVISEG